MTKEGKLTVTELPVFSLGSGIDLSGLKFMVPDRFSSLFGRRLGRGLDDDTVIWTEASILLKFPNLPELGIGITITDKCRLYGEKVNTLHDVGTIGAIADRNEMVETGFFNTHSRYTDLVKETFRRLRMQIQATGLPTFESGGLTPWLDMNLDFERFSPIGDQPFRALKGADISDLLEGRCAVLPVPHSKVFSRTWRPGDEIPSNSYSLLTKAITRANERPVHGVTARFVLSGVSDSLVGR